MSAWLIALTGAIYLAVAIEQATKGNWQMAVVFSGYSFSNIGLYLIANAS